MPHLLLRSNRRVNLYPRRTATFISLTNAGVSTTRTAASGAASVAIDAEALSYGLKTSDVSVTTPSGNTGREAKIQFEATGYLEIAVEPEDNADRFVMIKRISPIMPDPTPLDSRGKPT